MTAPLIETTKLAGTNPIETTEVAVADLTGMLLKINVRTSTWLT